SSPRKSDRPTRPRSGTQKAATDRAREAGTRLIEAKSLLKYGEWLPWLKEVGIAPRSAQRHMELAKIPEDKYVKLAHLGIVGAIYPDRTPVEIRIAEDTAKGSGFFCLRDDIGQFRIPGKGQIAAGETRGCRLGRIPRRLAVRIRRPLSRPRDHGLSQSR